MRGITCQVISLSSQAPEFLGFRYSNFSLGASTERLDLLGKVIFVDPDGKPSLSAGSRVSNADYRAFTPDGEISGQGNL